MERNSKLVDLTLVSKYYPVANYSYPRNESAMRSERIASYYDRSSMDSEGSAPGLVDDRTDSDYSGDEDLQYHTHTTELWDSFWRAGSEDRKRKEEMGTGAVAGTVTGTVTGARTGAMTGAGAANPRKQYPALIPSPQQRRKNCQAEEAAAGQGSPGWPLPESPGHRPRRRLAAATYSPFPKPIALPKPSSPSWQSSRPREQPRRPPRPDERLLTPCIQQHGFSSMGATLARAPQPPPPGPSRHSADRASLSMPRTPVSAPAQAPVLPEQPRPSVESKSLLTPRGPAPTPAPTPTAEEQQELRRPQMPTRAAPTRPPTPTDVARDRPRGRQSAYSPPPPPPPPPSSSRETCPGEASRPRSRSRAHRPPPISIEPRRHKSSHCLRPGSPVDIHRPKTSHSNRPPTPSPSHADAGLLSPPEPFPMPPDALHYCRAAQGKSGGQLTPEPSPQSVFEDDSDSEGGGLSFFRFHKRAGSDMPRSARQAEPEPVRRRRGLTTPSPTRPAQEKKRPGAEVLGRMLGRRSR